DFSWPRGGSSVEPSIAETLPNEPPPTQAALGQTAPTRRQSGPNQAAQGAVNGKAGEPKQPLQKRTPSDGTPRPPLLLRPSASTQGLWGRGSVFILRLDLAQGSCRRSRSLPCRDSADTFDLLLTAKRKSPRCDYRVAI